MAFAEVQIWLMVFVRRYLYLNRSQIHHEAIHRPQILFVYKLDKRDGFELTKDLYIWRDRL